MYTQLIHPWEIEIFLQMIRLIPNYGNTHTHTQLIYFSNKPPYSGIVRKGGQPVMGGNPCHSGPGEPVGLLHLTALCRHLLDDLGSQLTRLITALLSPPITMVQGGGRG